MSDYRLNALIDACRKVNAATFSHIDGRDLFADLHPRKTLDIHRRVDGREAVHEGDWLSDLYKQVKELRKVLRDVELYGIDVTPPPPVPVDTNQANMVATAGIIAGGPLGIKRAFSAEAEKKAVP